MQLGLLMFPSPGGSANSARMAEQFGFDSLVFADTQCLTPEVWAQLMLAAGATERIEIGTGVTNPVSRDPAVTASSALGLQLESGGRVVLGIGRGDSSMAKIGQKPASLEVFDRYLQRTRAYLDGETVDRDGNPSRIEWLDDVEVPFVPIEVAATGPRVVEIAARRAERICFAVGADNERLADCIERAKAAADAAGRDPEALKFGAFINCVIHEDVAVAREGVRGGLSAFAHFSGFRGMDIESLPEGVRAAARHLRDNYDMTQHGKRQGAHAQALDADFIDQFGVVGPVETAIAKFKAIAETGIDFVRVVPGSRDMDPGIAAPSLLALAKQVLPAVA